MNQSVKITGLKLACFLIMTILANTAWSQAKSSPIRVRHPLDTVGFASHSWQMDSVMSRIAKLNRHGEGMKVKPKGIGSHSFQKAAICPHDDYVYAGWLYPEVLKNIHASMIILFGVAHKAKQFNIEGRLVFDFFDQWKEPYGNIIVPDLREEIMKNLPGEAFIVYDSLQQAEHSVEAIIPFLQYYNKKVRIVSILVPYMSYERMDHLADLLAPAIEKALKAKGLKWGRDVAIVMSTDAVHYGDEEWNGSNFAFYGCDDKGYAEAKEHEMKIINESLYGPLEQEKVKKFTQYTLIDDDYKSYKWTWCGRYSVPLDCLPS